MKMTMKIKKYIDTTQIDLETETKIGKIESVSV